MNFNLLFKNTTLIVLLIAIGCANKVIEHGSNLKRQQLQMLQINKTSIFKSKNILNKPTVIECNSTYLYLSRIYKKNLFSKSILLEQKNIKIKFNNKNLLEEVKIFKTNHKIKTFYNKKKITFKAKNLSMFEQISRIIYCPPSIT